MTIFRIILLGTFTCAGVYLFASAPEPLPDKSTLFRDSRSVHVSNMFNAVNAVNHAARAIYTERIVGVGLKLGLKFGEDWADPDVNKGPLPALFLRIVAGRMEGKPSRLGLYLGSDEPINKSNLFDIEQSVSFETLKLTKKAVIMPVDAVGFVGMYPDLASASPCVTCHNDHPDSPKTDWKLNDIMGATTWTYPTEKIGADDYLSTTEELFQSIEEAYGMYIDKVAKFDPQIEIGVGWPDVNKMALPDRKTFMTAVRKEASITIVEELILINPLDPSEKAKEIFK
jgi:adenylate cyclase